MNLLKRDMALFTMFKKFICLKRHCGQLKKFIIIFGFLIYLIKYIILNFLFYVNSIKKHFCLILTFTLNFLLFFTRIKYYY